jgi:hypothetical protein
MLRLYVPTEAAVLNRWTQQPRDVDRPTNPSERLMKPFQTKAVQLVLVAVAFALGYATFASAASTPHCRISEKTSANGTVHRQWTLIATTSATEPNGNSALASAPPVQTAEGVNAGVNGMPTGTGLASADPDDDDGSIDSDDVGSDPMGDDADDGDDLDGGDF